MPVREKAVATIATRKYVMVLGLIFMASVLAFTVFQQLLQSQVSTQVLNTIGRQSMLTQRVALFAALIEDEQRAEAVPELRANLKDAVISLQETREALRRRDQTLLGVIQGRLSDSRYVDEVGRLEEFLERIIQDGMRLATAELSALERRALADSIIARARGPAVAAMDRVIAAYDVVGRERTHMLQVFAVVGETITVLLLIFSGVAVFRPLVADIERQIREQRRIETYYRTILEHVGDGVVAFDRDHVIRYANGAFATMTQSDQIELRQATIDSYLPAIATIDGLFNQRTRWTEFVQPSDNGRDRHFEGLIYIFEFGGDLQCIVSLRDITERKDLENRLRTFFYGIEHSPLSIVITDTDGVIQYANLMAAETSGYPIDEIIGSTPRIFQSGETPVEAYQVMWHNLRAGKQWYGELLNKRRNGTLYWEYEALSALKNEKGEITHFIAIKEDVTEKKRAAATLEQAKSQAEAANRAKSEFLANMSHELRTPLNAIIGFGEIMDLELFGPHAVPQYKEYSRAIHDSATHLLGIINEILDYSKIEANKVVLYEEFVTLDEVVDAIHVLIRDEAKGKGVMLQMGNGMAEAHGLSIYVDVLRIKQILLNLTTNAIKFTPEGGCVEIDARLLRDGSLDLLVKDTGIGMKPEDIPRALERFSQVDSTLARKYEGTGLGLPISKTLVELHGGTLTLASVESKGTTAIVHLPARRVSHDPSAVMAEKAVH